MAYSKGSSGGGAFMNNAKGVCSYKDNPMSAASRVAPKCGPGFGVNNPDQVKANKMLQAAQKQQDSYRGMASY